MIPVLASWGCVIGLVALWRIATVAEKTPIGPAGLFACVWVFAAGAPLLVWPAAGGARLVYVSAFALVLAFCTVSVAVGMAAGRFMPKEPAGRVLPDGEAGSLKKWIVATFILSVFHPVFVGVLAGIQFGDFNVLVLPSLVAKARYDHTWDPPAYMSVVRVFMFVCAALCAFAMAEPQLKRRLKWWVFCWVLPAAMSFYVEASRMSFIFPALFAVASYCAGTAYFGTFRMPTLGGVAWRAAILTIVAVPAVHLGYSVRIGATDLDTNVALFSRSLSTAYGYMPALGYWIEEEGMARQESATGLYSLSGIMSVLGGSERPQGLYEENVRLETSGFEPSESNVYTGLRVLVDDFGIFGGLAFVALATFVGSLGWAALARGRIAGYGAVLAFAGFALCSPATFLYVYNSAVGAVISTALVLAWICRPRRAEP